jgi:hypothetical protein
LVAELGRDLRQNLDGKVSNAQYAAVWSEVDRLVLPRKGSRRQSRRQFGECSGVIGSEILLGAADPHPISLSNG